MPWLPYFLICVLVIWWQPNTWTNVCVLVDYIHHFRSKGWKHEENKLKKPTKTQRLKPSKEKQNIPIHRLNRWRQKIYVGAVVQKAGNWKYTHRLNWRWRYWTSPRIWYFWLATSFVPSWFLMIRVHSLVALNNFQMKMLMTCTHN